MDSAEPSAAQAADAITTLLCSHDGAAQQSADAWLAFFAASPSAWRACTSLLLHAQPEVAYFAANVILTKVRREWGETPPPQRASLFAALSAALLPASSAPLVARRLSLSLAAACVRGAPGDAAAFVASALELAASRPELALHLLSFVAEEADEAPGRRRAALLASLSPLLPPVLRLVASDDALAALPADALRCALRWLRLHPDAAPGGADAGGALLLSPPELAAAAPRLLPFALAALGHPDDGVRDAAADLLAEAHGPGPRRAGAAEEAASASDAISGLLALRGAARAPDGLRTAKCVCSLHNFRLFSEPFRIHPPLRPGPSRVWPPPWRSATPIRWRPAAGRGCPWCRSCSIASPPAPSAPPSPPPPTFSSPSTRYR